MGRTRPREDHIVPDITDARGHSFYTTHTDLGARKKCEKCGMPVIADGPARRECPFKDEGPAPTAS